MKLSHLPKEELTLQPELRPGFLCTNAKDGFFKENFVRCNNSI